MSLTKQIKYDFKKNPFFKQKQLVPKAAEKGLRLIWKRLYSALSNTVATSYVWLLQLKIQFLSQIS